MNQFQLFCNVIVNNIETFVQNVLKYKKYLII